MYMAAICLRAVPESSVWGEGTAPDFFNYGWWIYQENSIYAWWGPAKMNYCGWVVIL